MNNNDNKKEETAAERIARYKEERRRQIQAKFLSATSKLKNDQQSDEVPNNTMNSPVSDSYPSVKTTRTSRLRAAARSGGGTADVADQKSRDNSKEKLVTSRAITLTTSGSRTKPEKDKSSLRKSNLNRSLPSSSTQETPRNASHDEHVKNRRMRRRFFPPEVLRSQNNTAAAHQESNGEHNAVIACSSSTSSNLQKVKNEEVSGQPNNNNKENLKRINLLKSENAKRAAKVKSPRISKRLEELTAFTKETLVRVEKLTKVHNARNNCFVANEASKIGTQQTNESSAAGPTAVSTPISILKRKEATTSWGVHHHNASPVTFSPTVVDPETTTKRRQGILKKRRSLDESQVLRHRSCSPDVASLGGSSKTSQRRSSLEEITKIAPDLQGILKRRSARHDDDDASLNSPQSILKRKSGSSSAGSVNAQHGHQHVSITTAVILAAAKGAEMILDDRDDSDPVVRRPILKKKSFSEDGGGGDGESLKPILKKKSSTETDDDEKPKRPILKTRSASNPQQDSNNYSAYESGSDCEVRPILKSRDSSRPRLSRFYDNQDGEEFAPRKNRSSFDQSQSGVVVGGGETRTTVSSVSELVMSFEKNLNTGAIPKQLAPKRNSNRFKTQPVTVDELEASLSFIQAAGGCTKHSSNRLESKSVEFHVSNNGHDDHQTTNGDDILNQVPSVSLQCTDYSSSLAPKMSFDSAFQSLGDGLEIMDDSDPTKNKKLDLQQQMKNIALEAKKFKSQESQATKSSRHFTQPVTSQEVLKAMKEKDGNNRLPDPFGLSIKEKVKLFTVTGNGPLKITVSLKSAYSNSYLNLHSESAIVGDALVEAGREQNEDEGISSNDDDETEHKCDSIDSNRSSGESEEVATSGKPIEDTEFDVETSTDERRQLEGPRESSTIKVPDDGNEPLAKSKSATELAMQRSIEELAAKLQQRGNNDWRKRIPSNTSQELNLLNVKNLYNDELSSDKPSSILQLKKDELDCSSRLWRNRVEKPDADNFTVAGRMAVEEKIHDQCGISKSTSLILTPDKRIPIAKRFKGKEEEKHTSLQAINKECKKEEVSVTGTDSHGVIKRKVQVSRPDDETFKSFFKSVEVKHDVTDTLLNASDFDCVVRQTLLVQKKDIKVQKRQNISKFTNPLKQLSKREDILTEYTETITDFPQQETKRLNVEKLAKSNPHLAVEALAGLASKEDLKAVALKKPSLVNNGTHLPFQNIMLLHVKGRKHVQTRLIEPLVSNMNQGDCYILITPRNLFHFVGYYSNVIEQARSSDIINQIVKTGDMGCKVEKATVINARKSSNNVNKETAKFWRHLGAENGAECEITNAGNADEDELYESNIVTTNMVYSLEKTELVPMEQCWGALPKYSVLTDEGILVFDFGSEMYVWSGKNADHDRKKLALTLAKEMWNQGFNYADCNVCPLNVSQILGTRTDTESTKTSPSRPEWALFAKITQNRETILFKEKFADWPDNRCIIKVKSDKNGSRQNSTDSDNKLEQGMDNIRLCDMSSLWNAEHPEPDFEVEGSHLGRGANYYDKETNRHFEVHTLDVTKWSISENSYEKVPDAKKEHFYDNFTYIIRWQFRVTVTGRELSGKPSKHCLLGRDRCVYFCWLGRNATVNEKGAAALLTVELDSENAKQLRVMQGSEPPVFLQLFNGRMVVHSEKFENKSEHLYIVRGEVPSEVALVEVEPTINSLRSRTSFVAIQRGNLVLWHGIQSSENTRKNALRAADFIIANKAMFELVNDVEIKEIEEGHENELCLDCNSVDNKVAPFLSLKESSVGRSFDKTPKLFHFTSIMGKFEANEILCPHRCSDYVTSYPFLQTDLYSASQPALFLLDNDHELWLWQGWWPEKENDSENFEQTGSGPVRWQAERRAAMQTALQYWSLTHEPSVDGEEKVPAYLVWAGHEPIDFTNLFPFWTVDREVKQLNSLQVEEKSSEDRTGFVSIETELALLTRDTYTIDELMQRPLPNGVDPSKLEIYLSSESFVTLMSMTREEFQALPVWKQTKLKKDKGLF